MAEKQEVLSIKGLATDPNEFGEVPAGTMAEAENCLIRRPGVIQPLPAPTTLATYNVANQVIGATFAGLGSEVMTIGGATSSTMNRAVWRPSNTDFAFGVIYGFSGFRDTLFDPCKIRLSRSRGRTMLTEHTSPLIADNESSAARLMGLPMPTGFAWQSYTDNVPVLLHQNYTTYTACFLWDDGNGYQYRGAPCPPFIIFNSSGSIDRAPRVRLYWSKSHSPNVLGSNFWIELYRASQDPDIEALDEEFALVLKYQLESADPANGYADLFDTCPDSAKGASLYTNQFQNGAEGANFMPPTCSEIITYKGVTFFVGSSSWSQIELGVRGSFGDLTSNNDAYGIGVRTVNVNLTNGSNTGTLPTPTGVGSPDGMAVGQLVTAAGFAAGTTITTFSAGLGTIAFSNNYTGATGLHVISTADVIRINGTRVPIELAGVVPFVQALSTLDLGVVMIPEDPYFDSGTPQTYSGFNFILFQPIPGPNFTLELTNPQNYTQSGTGAGAHVPSVLQPSNDPRTNRVYFSNELQPEVVRPLNFFDVGNGIVYRLMATESAIYAYCSDGIFRITTDGLQMRVDLVDQTTILLHPNALDAMNGTTYGWFTKGFCRIDDGAPTVLSNAIRGDVNTVWESFNALNTSVGARAFVLGTQIVCDHKNNEVWWQVSALVGASSAGIEVARYIFNATTGEFTTMSDTPQAMTYSSLLLELVGATDDTLVTWTSVNSNPATVRFNPLFGGGIGDLKQWMSVVLSWGADLDATFQPTFDGSAGVSATALVDESTYVVPVPRRAALGKQLVFGFRTSGTPATFILLALSVRVRVASETLKRE